MLARVAKLADARDLKSRVLNRTYRFNSGPGHQTEPAQKELVRQHHIGRWNIDEFSILLHFSCNYAQTLPNL